jgi:hypothetical protein
VVLTIGIFACSLEKKPMEGTIEKALESNYGRPCKQAGHGE